MRAPPPVSVSPGTMPARWEDLTAALSKIKARSMSDFQTLTARDDGTVDPANGRMQEARDVLRRKLTNSLSAYALRYDGGVPAYLDAIAARSDVGVEATPEDEHFGRLVEDAVANAFRFVYYDGASMIDADLWATKRRAAEKELNEALSALVAVVPVTLGSEASTSRTRRTATRSSAVDVYSLNRRGVNGA